MYDYLDVVFVMNDFFKVEDLYKIFEDICVGFRDEIYFKFGMEDEALFLFLKDMYEVYENV